MIRKITYQSHKTSKPWSCDSNQDLAKFKTNAPAENKNHLKQTTALSSSMKLWAMLCKATQDRQVMAESSDKMWSIGEGNGKHLQYSCV